VPELTPVSPSKRAGPRVAPPKISAPIAVIATSASVPAWMRCSSTVPR
jgi:hypothetical protein